MITFEQQMKRIVDVLPTFFGSPIRFHWGDINELNQFLTTLDANQKYPLIWLSLGRDNRNVLEKTISRNATLVFATNVSKERINDLNNVVFETYFDEILNPLAENFIQAIKASGISKFKSDTIQEERMPKFSINSNEKQIIDIWHALTIQADIEFSTQQCNINTIKFQNRWQLT